MKNLTEKIQRYYKLGLYRPEHLDKLVQTGVITEEQKREITGAK